MSIDKESTGLPEVHAHRPDTKVNLWMIGGLLLFLALGAAAAVWIARRPTAPAAPPAQVVR